MARMEKYYDGVSIAKQLPDSYMVGRGSKQCYSCHYYESMICNKWKAMVKKNWVCKSYKVRKRINTPGDITPSTPSTPSTPNTNSNTGGSTGGY